MKFKKLLILGFLLIALVALPVSFAADMSVTDLNPNDMGGTDLGLEEVNQSISSTSIEEDVATLDTSNLLDNETVYLNGSYTGSVEKGTLKNPYKNINNATKALLNSNKTNLFIANGNYKINNHFDVTDKNINIIGESVSGVKVDCNKDYLFAFTNSSSNIYNLIITNGYSNSDYAIIWTELSNITMCNVVFTNNLANSPGGIILTKNGNFKLINSSIKNNLIDYNGGISGGIIYSEGINLTIINSSFINNTIKSTSYYGGFIYVKGSLEFINSTISKLYVNASGVINGAFIYYEQDNDFDKGYIINSSFEKSNFTGATGLILTSSRFFVINNTNISDNYALYLQGNISVLDLYYNSYIENLNIFNNTYRDVSVNLTSVMNFLYRNGYFNISEQLPDRYDLRDYNLTTSVKDQHPLGTCWAFATMAALESYLLKNWNETFDLSENNMKNIMGKYGINGSEWDTNTGGNDVLALAYLLRWSGPVNESTDPYYSDIAKLYDAVAHVQDVIYIPLRLNYTDNDQIKYAIWKYGAVWTEMNSTGFGKNTYSPICGGSDHAVAIVGWDDNYSASNFEITPPGDGAFIVKNSWGPGWGDNGYFYVSYYDASFAGFASNAKFSGYVFANVEKVNNYDSIYYYDPFGNDYVATGYLSNIGWFANQFITNKNEILSAFGIYTYGDSNYLTNIYINNKLVYTQEGNLYNSGYHTIKLNKQLGLNKGDIFKIEIKLTTPNCLYPIAVEVPLMGDNPFVNATANPNESFVSVDGVTWDDLTDLIENANVCIKAYTVNPNYVIEVNETEIKAYVDDTITLEVFVKDLTGVIKDLSEGQLNIIFSESIVITPTIIGNTVSFTIPDSNVSGNLIIEFISSNYPTIFTNLNLTLLKKESILNVSPDKTIYILENGSFVINISDEDDNPVCEGIVEVYEDGVSVANLTVTTGTVIWDYKYNKSGVYNISIVYKGTNRYESSNLNRVITVNKLSTTLSLEMDVKIIYVYETNNFIIGVYDIKGNPVCEGIVEVYEDGVSVANLTVTTGTVIYKYVPNSSGEHIISLIYKENNKYLKSNFNDSISVDKLNTNLSLKSVNASVLSSALLVANVESNHSVEGTVTFYVGDTKVATVNVINGVAKYNYNCKSVGNFVIKAVFNENNAFKSSQNTSKLTVNKIPVKMTIKQNNTYYKSSFITITLNKSINGQKINLKFSNGKNVTVTTNSKGIATYYIPFAVGSYTVNASASNNLYNIVSLKNQKITIKKVTATITASNFTTTYKSEKYLQIKVTNSNKQVMSGVKLKLKVYTGSSYKTISITTDSKGIAKYDGSSLSVSKHKIVISSGESTKYMAASTKTIYLTVNKGTTNVIAPPVTYKKGVKGYLTINVTNKVSKKPINALVIKVKLSLGNKSKTFSFKTNINGIVKVPTKSLPKGNINVVISTSNKNYVVSKSGILIKIK